MPATTSKAPDETAGPRQALREYFAANATGDYEQVCSLFTVGEQERAARAHDPGGSGSCVNAFKAEAKSLGDSLAAANEISAGAKIDSISVANGAATAIVLFGGGSEPTTAELRRVGSRWLIEREP